MKKTFYGGMAALSFIAILASGCARETVETKNDKQIKFTTVVGKQTRAEEFNYWAPGGIINVQSFPDGSPASFREFALTYGGGGIADWTYVPPVPLPGVPLVFYSIYNGDNVGNENLSGVAGSFEYTEPFDDELQVDLIAAYVGPTDDPLVVLMFKHLLTQVNFAIQGLDGVQYELTDIRLNGIAASGTYTFPIGGGVEGWSNITPGTQPLPYRPYNDVSITPAGSDEIFFLGNRPAEGNNPADYSFDNALMVIPQNLSGVSLEFDYTIYDRDGTPIPGATGTMNIDLSTPEVSDWKESTRYVYVIDFTGEVISFHVDIMPWEDYQNLLIVNP